MRTNWATGSLWVVWIICKHFPFYRLWFWFWFPGVAALCSGMKSRFVGSVWSVWGVVKTTTTPCDRCTDSATSFWQMLRDGMVWGGFVIKGGNLNAERYPGWFRLHISTAGDQTLSSNVPTEQFYQGLPPVLRSGEDWMTWQQLTDLIWLTSNLKLIISKSIIRQTNALHKKNKARLIKKKVSTHWTGNSRAVMGWRGEVTQWEITLNRQTPLVWKEAHSSHS